MGVQYSRAGRDERQLDTIRRVLAADVESFRGLVERYQRPLLTLIRNLTPPDTDPEGVAQEVFLAGRLWGARQFVSAKDRWFN